jgi:fucose 4-O-acetylase-like acetyltransferase
MKNNNRDIYWDLVKGLGIIAIVIGHTGSPLLPYVYMYHLMLFFFIAGYLFNDKYSHDIYGFIGKRIQSQWVMAVKYCLLFVALHNLLLTIGVYSAPETIHYNYRNFISAATDNLLLQGSEQMCGALWFIPLLFFSILGFCFIRSLTRNIESNVKRELINSSIILALCYFGIFLNNRNIGLIYHMQLCFLIFPVLQTAFLLKQYKVNIPYKWYFAIASVAVLYWVKWYTHKNVELSQSQIIGPQYLYLVSFAGIYANLYLGKILLRFDKITQIISYLGNKSFQIMALHFVFFKPVEYYLYLTHNEPFKTVSSFPTSSKSFWLLYVVLGVSLPAITLYYAEKLQAQLKSTIIYKKLNIKQ